MAYKTYLSQRTNRHVVKRLSSDSAPATYDSLSFGVWSIPGVTNSDLNFPWGVAADGSDNIYICDTNNQRIVKLDSSCAFVAVYDVTNTVGTPYSMLFDSTSGDLYVAGVYANLYVRIERITTALVQVRLSGNLNSMNDLWFRPTAICPDFTAGNFIVAGANLDLYITTETTSFSTFVQQAIGGETTTWPEIYETTKYNGAIKHSVNSDLYLNNGRKIIRVDSSYDNIGDSDKIAKTITGLKEGKSGTLLTYNADEQKIVRYDSDLNFVEDVYVDSGSVIATDAYDVMDFVEIDV